MPMRQVHIASIKSLLDELIDRHAEAYLTAYPKVEEFSSFEKSGTFNYYIGMVWTSDNEKPNTQALRIRGSQSLTKSKMVELDLSQVKDLQSFFPGQIVAFFAEPFLKSQVIVKSFLDPTNIIPPTKHITTDAEVNLLIASGPFMKNEHEDWTIYNNIIEKIKTTGATHVILLGPFVDLDNKLMRAHYDESWRSVFDKLIEGLHEHSCQIFLVPSTRDILPSNLSSNYFYPCQQIELKSNLKSGAQPKCSIKPVTDPAQIDLGGIYVDATSADVLFHLNKCTSFINKGDNNPFDSIFRNILSHGICPMYPPPCDIAVDYAGLRQHLILDRLSPHILVVPTRFGTSNVKEVENRLAVAIHKCSIKKHALLIKIAKIDSGEDKFIKDEHFTSEVINLVDDLTQ